MNYRERIRKAIECPQFGDETYGEWGALNLEQRKFIKRLLDELDRADNYIKKVYLENQELKEQLLVTQTNEETFRLEMEDITRILGLDEDIIFDDVKTYARSLKENISCNWKDSCLENAGKIEILENQQKEFISYLENEIYSIEPKGTGINYNCEYDSEEDYINAMEEQSKLNTFKEILSKYKEIIGDVNSENK